MKDCWEIHCEEEAFNLAKLREAMASITERGIEWLVILMGKKGWDSELVGGCAVRAVDERWVF